MSLRHCTVAASGVIDEGGAGAMELGGDTSLLLLLLRAACLGEEDEAVVSADGFSESAGGGAVDEDIIFFKMILKNDSFFVYVDSFLRYGNGLSLCQDNVTRVKGTTHGTDQMALLKANNVNVYIRATLILVAFRVCNCKSVCMTKGG
jgi:hypothetical protein